MSELPDPIPEDHPQIQFLAFEEVEEVVGEPPGFVHHMHRHFDADQLMVPLQGSVVMLDEARTPRELRAGEAMVVPRYRWHEVRNESCADCVVFNLFSGVGEMSEVGFEAFSGD